MGDKSSIEWTDATWNPITGCSKVSPGCAHCYAETLALTRLRGRPGYPGLPWTPENAAANVTLRPERLDQPLRWRRPRRIFVNSLSDLFHELVVSGRGPMGMAVSYTAAVFAVMAAAPRHTFQVLTKRPHLMRRFCTSMAKVSDYDRQVILESAAFDHGLDLSCDPTWPLPNVWLGTSVENQHWADVRIPELLETPAAVRFVSMEPLLGEVDLTESLWAKLPLTEGYIRRPDGLGWIIVGGESGPIHRPVDPFWVRKIRDQAHAAGVAFLFKQWGGRTSKSGGRELDGRTWDEYPEALA